MDFETGDLSNRAVIGCVMVLALAIFAASILVQNGQSTEATEVTHDIVDEPQIAEGSTSHSLGYMESPTVDDPRDAVNWYFGEGSPD